MGEWMEYIHMQKPKPTNAVGVPVTLTAVDSSGKTEEIGVVTSNMYGNFGASWTPKVSGLYQIIATFAGTNSYGDSAASTFVTVSPAAAASAPATSTPIATPTPTVTSTATVQPTPSPAVNPTSGSDTAVYVGLAALVIILAVAAIALVLRRRK
jgi:hypothetical protein